LKCLSDTEAAEIDALVGLPETPPDDGELVDAADLSEWLGLTPNRVSALAREGVLPRTPDKLFPLKAAVRSYADHARAGATGRRVDSDMAAEKLRAAKATAEKLEIQNAKSRGDLLDGKQVANEWRGIITDLRAAVLAVPSRVAGRMGLDRATTAALDTEIRDAMGAISDDH
jgi:phage terminase Nu1 subunit (DNA packaging protein)